MERVQVSSNRSFNPIMDLVEFRERIYGKYNNQLFIFETAWDCFRPIVSIGWNGKDFGVDDKIYKQDLFSPYYGYGTIDMRQVCKHLIRITELGTAKKLTDPITLWKWSGQTNASWWNDRPVVFLNSCVDRSRDSWKRYVQFLHSKAKTLRRNVAHRATKRLSVK